MRKLRILVLSLAAMSALAALSAASAFALSPPVNTAKPAVLGLTEVGGTLRTGNGTWTESPTSYTYQWQRCNAAGAECSNLSGATEKAYVATPADQGHTLVSVVSAHNAAGEGSASSKPTAPITPPKMPYFKTSGANYPDSFTFSTERAEINLSSGGVNCSSMTGSGSITSPTEVGSAKVVLSGCEEHGGFGFGCSTIESGTLHGNFGYVNEAQKRVGLLLEPQGSVFATNFRCKGAQTTIDGSVIAEITPVNTSTTSYSLGYSAHSGVQSPNAFNSGGVHQLEWNWPKGAFEKFGINATDSFSASVKGEIVA